MATAMAHQNTAFSDKARGRMLTAGGAGFRQAVSSGRNSSCIHETLLSAMLLFLSVTLPQ
jgi:hypothetical protein